MKITSKVFRDWLTDEELNEVIWVKKKILRNSELKHRLKTRNLIVEKDKDMLNKEQIYFSYIFMSTQILN